MELLASIFTLYRERAGWFLGLLGAHAALAATAVALAGTLGLALGVAIAEHRRFAPLVIGVCNVCYTWGCFCPSWASAIKRRWPRW